MNTVSERPRPDLGSGVEADSGAGAGLRSNVPADRGLIFPATHSSLQEIIDSSSGGLMPANIRRAGKMLPCEKMTTSKPVYF